MGGLGEHVEGVTTLEVVAGFTEVFQVAGEGAGVAGDVDDLLRVKVDERLAGFGTETSAGRIEHNQVDRFDLFHDFGQDHFNSAFIETEVFKLVQIAHKIEAG